MVSSPITRLSDLCTMVVDCPHSTPVWTDRGYVVLRNQNIKGGRLDLSAPSYTDADHFAHRIRRAQPQNGDIVITREAPMGEVCMIPEGLECCLGQRQVLLRPDVRKTTPRYLLYALQSRDVQDQIAWNEGTGSTVSNIRIPVLESLKIPTPPLAEQHEISETLGTLDDKIALLRATNATLEAIALAIFKSWFVDFDPVRAKEEGRDPEGVPPEVADLFPGAFEDSELGAIPKGWRVRTLNDLTIKIGSGATPRGGKESYVEEGIALVRSQNVYDAEFTWDGLARITDEQAEALSNVELQVGDVLLNITGASILRTCVVDSGVLPARVNQHVAIIRAKKDIPNRYIHQHLLRKSTKDYLMGMNAGASREAVTKGHIESVPILLPPLQLLAQFRLLTEPGFARIESNAGEIRSLTDLRDTLLPRLMSGKLRIPLCEEVTT